MKGKHAQKNFGAVGPMAPTPLSLKTQGGGGRIKGPGLAAPPCIRWSAIWSTSPQLDRVMAISDACNEIFGTKQHVVGSKSENSNKKCAFEQKLKRPNFFSDARTPAGFGLFSFPTAWLEKGTGRKRNHLAEVVRSKPGRRIYGENATYPPILAFLGLFAYPTPRG